MRRHWQLIPLFLLLCVSPILAHQGGFGYWSVRIQSDSVHSIVSISLLDLNFIPDLDADGNGYVEYEEVVRHQRSIQDRILEHFMVRGAGQEATLTVQDFQVLQSGGVVLQFEHQFPQNLEQVELESTFPELTDFEHRVFCKVEYGGALRQLVFDRYTTRHGIDLSGVWSGRSRQMGRFLVLGIEHIFTGYDHLAFLLGLILLGGSVRKLIGIVSSFTIAHSITLSLATLDVIVLPTQFVESAIALSICYIALENILIREINGRWKITFFFGLIHGFGFSNILREMHLPRAGLATSLFSFNLGVEVGQVVIIAMLCPLIFLVARQSWHKVAVTVTSVLIGCLGLVWFVERVV